MMTHQKPDELQNYAVIFEQVVAWNDMDALSHVNNVVYYRYAESARIAYLQKLDAFGNDVSFVLAHSSCTYLIPIVFPDTLLIGVRTKKIGNTSLIMEYCYYSTVQQRVAATGEAVLVRLDKEGTDKVVWQIEEREKLIALEQTAGYVPEQ